jgi:hypothetical protein
MTMTQMETVREYLHCLGARDGSGAAALFSETGVMDDANGRHHVGRQAVQGLLDASPNDMRVNAPLHHIEEGKRVVVYGILNGAMFGPAGAKMRWVFHFENGRIAHLGNSFVNVFPGA